jgi:hypothetical protein
MFVFIGKADLFSTGAWGMDSGPLFVTGMMSHEKEYTLNEANEESSSIYFET